MFICYFCVLVFSEAAVCTTSLISDIHVSHNVFQLVVKYKCEYCSLTVGSVWLKSCSLWQFNMPSCLLVAYSSASVHIWWQHAVSQHEKMLIMLDYAWINALDNACCSLLNSEAAICLFAIYLVQRLYICACLLVQTFNSGQEFKHWNKRQFTK